MNFFIQWSQLIESLNSSTFNCFNKILNLSILMVQKVFTRVLIGALYLLSLLPFQLLYQLSDFIFLLLYKFPGYRKKVVQKNLKNSFPSKTNDELGKIEKEFYHFLADLMIESVKLITTSRVQALKHFKIENMDLLEGYFAQGKSIIAVSGHYGNWEMMNILALDVKYQTNVVYKPLTNTLFDSFWNRVRSEFGATLVPMSKVLRHIASNRKNLSITLLVSDQTPSSPDAQFYTQFLNQHTPVFTGVEKIARSMNSPVVFCDITVIKRGYYSCKFVTIAEDPSAFAENEITLAHVAYLEGMINRNPQYWLWSHNRWKFNQ